jgi:hypothetical protein
MNSVFSTVSTVGDRVYKRGKVFQAGEYPDKNVTVTVEQLRQGAAKFTPCPINIEHWHSVLDGKLGELVSIEVMDDGSVYGTTSIPKALADLLGDDPVPVSIELRHNDWVIIGLAFAKNPRVTDAAVFAAFGMEQPPDKRKGKQMDLKGLLKSAFSKAVDEIPDDQLGVDTKPTVKTEPVTDPALEAKLKEANEAREKAEKERDELRAKSEADAATAEGEKILAASKEFAAHYVGDRRILPAQVEAVAAQYATAVRADAGGKSAFASDGKIVEGDAVTSLRKMLDTNPQHRFTADMMGQAQFKTVNGDNATDSGMSADRKKALMGKSALGRQAMKVADKGANC